MSRRVAASDEVVVLSGVGSGSEGLEAGQVALLEQLERGAAAGGDVVDASARPNWATAAAESPPPTTVKPLRVGDGLGDGAGAGLEARILEDAHRPVPEHGAGLDDHVAELGRRAGSDVERPSSRRGCRVPS